MAKNKVPQETKGESEGRLYQGGNPSLTPTEAVIYHLWANEYLTPLQIALRRGISDKTVYKHIKSIKYKGYVLNMVERGEKTDPTIHPSVSDGTIRLHGQHFVLKLLGKRPVYDEIRKRGNVQYVMDCTVKLHRESIEVHASHGLSFFGASADKATAKSMEFWTRTLHRLETHLGVVLVKARSQNIKQVSAHYALVGCGVAREAVDAGDRVQIYSREDGKLWFTIDNSFNLRESETLHPETAQRDMQDVVMPHLNDWRDNPGLWPQSELQRAVQLIVKGQGDLALALQGLAAQQSALTGVVKAVLDSQRPPERDRPALTPPFYIG